ncbi:sugar phosphate isomerase/epimerase family protein [Agrococcus sp. Marseille-P2731]|uniref:sugar phosphate isomerase/epimerase family protein n=1 Tax=Agrococcus sp. Marseille-P2731 TaxID=1841862 RepID=UPI0009300AB0|nr:TIM barrel protein [Agrococcus sp. Marseille-P2731]
MKIGIGSYALFWEWHDHPQPLSIEDMVDRASDLDCEVFEICDDPRIEAYDADALAALRARAEAAGLALQLGTRGIAPAHLAAYIDIARALGASVLRSMVQREDAEQGAEHIVDLLSLSTQALEAADVTLALETYEQIPTALLLATIEGVGSDRIGVCLDPANVVAALELPNDVIDAAASRTVDLHVKDFAFARRDGWVGFTYSGARMGEGQLDLARELSAVYADGRSPAAIVEHWLPWQGDSATTVAMERVWTDATIAALRASAPAHHSDQTPNRKQGDPQ